MEDGKALTAWLVEHVLPQDQHPDHLHNQILERCRALHIEPPTPERIDRLVRSALHTFETRFCAATCKRLSPQIRERLEALLLPESTAASDPREPLEPGWAVLTRLLADPGPANLESLLEEIAKLDQVRALGLPQDLFDDISPKVLQTYRRRLAAEAAYELRRHAAPLRLTLLAVFGHLRERELTDTLGGSAAEPSSTASVPAPNAASSKNCWRTSNASPARMACSSSWPRPPVAQPDGIVKDVVYPVVNEQTLRDLVKEWKASGPAYRKHVQTVIRNSYRSHYRRMVPRLLHTLDFRSNNETHQPVLDALALLKKYADSKLRPTRPTRTSRWRAWCAAPGRKPSWSRTRTATRASIASPTRSASSKPSASGFAAKRSGSRAPTATATPTRTCPPTSTRSEPPTMPPCSSPRTPTRLSPRCDRR